MKLILDNQADTIKLGQYIGESIEGDLLILLKGDLGAGKTTLTKGIAKGLGIDEVVTSPTFTIAKTYKGRLPLNHIDAYRLEGIGDDFGLEDYLNEDSVTVIEWSDFLNIDFKNFIELTIKYVDDKRSIEYRINGKNLNMDIEEVFYDFRDRYID